jgi:hypothetical protein
VFTFIHDLSPKQRSWIATGVAGAILAALGTWWYISAHQAPPARLHVAPAVKTVAPPKPRVVVAAPVNPLTGLSPVPTGPVIAVKIDDTAPGRPSAGLDKADVIYIEEAEGGQSRMLAVFASAKPQVEAVRSVRASDPELLGAYLRPVLVASGGGGSSLPTLDRSILHPVINDRGQVGFHRDQNRPAPYNLVSDLNVVSRAFPNASGARDVGFTWNKLFPAASGGRPGALVSTLVGSTPMTFSWGPRSGTYVRTIGGIALRAADGRPVARANVLIQYCQVRADRGDVDVLGNPSMYTETIGRGKIVLFRNGKRIDGTWSRASQGATTKYQDVHGKPLPLAPGGTFVLLVRPGVGA